MNKHTYFLIIISGFLLFFSCKSTKKIIEPIPAEEFRIGFYNVENLFDTIDNKDKFDEEFTPQSKKKWNTERYYKKLNDLAKIVDAIEYPAILGLCEVENKLVLEDFIGETSLRDHRYTFVHFESPDARGIDVALLYQRKLFTVLNKEKITIDFPKSIVGDKPYSTRDILHVEGIFNNRDTLHLYVNHFPSRRGGLEESEPKRIYVAQQLRKSVDQVFSNNNNANIIIMGDFNDETNNNSIMKTLNAKPVLHNIAFTDLVNCSAGADAEGKGTYNYRGNWNMLDQMIVSGNLFNKESKIQTGEFGMFQEEWMMFKSDKYGWTPNRTYGGPNYYGGYSDHLPVYLGIKIFK